MRERCDREVGVVKRECELLRREFAVLNHEVGLERGLAALRAEVDEARAALPKQSAKVEQLEAETRQLRRELKAAEQRIGKLQAEQSTTELALSEVRMKMTRNRTAAEMEISSLSLRLREITPEAKRTLRAFADAALPAPNPLVLLWNETPAGTA